MRIGWVTPLDAESAVSRHALEVIREMRSRGLKVQIVRVETGEAAPAHKVPDEISVGLLDEASIETLRADFDLVVVALTNQFDPSFGRLQVLRSLPSVGLFYDADLDRLSRGSTGAEIDPDAVKILRDIGPIARSGDHLFGEDLAWISLLCAGAVVHSKHYLEPLKAHCPGPAIVIPLCLRDPGKARVKRREGDFTIVAVGRATANNQVDRVMRAVAQSPILRGRATCRLIGTIAEDERSRLLSLAGELHIRPPEFPGPVSAERLQEACGEAHVICCLRYPIVQGGSSTLIHSLYSAVPVIVANAGAYAEVPDELVWKVSYGADTGDLMRALESVAEDQEAADRRGAAARDWACHTCSVSTYVDKLVPLLEECLGVTAVIDAGRQLGRTLYDIGALLDEPAAERVGAVLQNLFSARPEDSRR